MSKELISFMNGDAVRKEVEKLLGSKPMVDRAIRLATSALTNPDPKNMLPKCSAQSILGAFIRSVQLNLEPNTVLGECYLIPRQIKGQWEANFELGYKGLIKLAYRSGEVKLIQAHEVYENDLFDADYGESKLLHKPYLKGDRGNIVAYWARYILKDGTSDFSVWSVQQAESHRDQYSKSAGSNYSPWSTAFHQMAKKSVIKDALRYAPLSVEDMRLGLASDDTVIEAENGVKFPDQKPSILDVLSKPMQVSQKEIIYEDSDEEKQRMEVFDRVEKKIAEKKAAGMVDAVIVNTIGFELADIEKQPIERLLRIMKDLG
jgi:recombination protein RecT